MIIPSFYKVCKNNVYHLNADLMHLYTALRIVGYETLTPFSQITVTVYSGFTEHMLSTNSLVIFRSTCSFTFPVFKSAYKHAPGVSKIATSLPLYASISSVVMIVLIWYSTQALDRGTRSISRHYGKSTRDNPLGISGTDNGQTVGA